MKLTAQTQRIDKGMQMLKRRLEALRLRKSYVKAGVLGTSGDSEEEEMKKKGYALEIGPRGGRFYINKNGHKIYPGSKYKGAAPEDPKKERPSNATLASIHEFGLGNVPARPFIRPPFDKNRKQYLEILSTAYEKFLKGSGDRQNFLRVLGFIGQKMASDIKNYVTQGTGVPPPLSPKTIAAKGSSRPLVDTGQLLNSVTYQVVE